MKNCRKMFAILFALVGFVAANTICNTFRFNNINEQLQKEIDLNYELIQELNNKLFPKKNEPAKITLTCGKCNKKNSFQLKDLFINKRLTCPYCSSYTEFEEKKVK